MRRMVTVPGRRDAQVRKWTRWSTCATAPSTCPRWTVPRLVNPHRAWTSHHQPHPQRRQMQQRSRRQHSLPSSRQAWSRVRPTKSMKRTAHWTRWMTTLLRAKRTHGSIPGRLAPSSAARGDCWSTRQRCVYLSPMQARARLNAWARRAASGTARVARLLCQKKTPRSQHAPSGSSPRRSRASARARAMPSRPSRDTSSFASMARRGWARSIG